MPAGNELAISVQVNTRERDGGEREDKKGYTQPSCVAISIGKLKRVGIMCWRAALTWLFPNYCRPFRRHVCVYFFRLGGPCVSVDRLAIVYLYFQSKEAGIRTLVALDDQGGIHSQIDVTLKSRIRAFIFIQHPTTLSYYYFRFYTTTFYVTFFLSYKCFDVNALSSLGWFHFYYLMLLQH